MRLLVTGASGRLGRALKHELETTGALAPHGPIAWTGLSSSDADVSDAKTIHDVIQRARPTAVLHAAAYTDVASAERERAACWGVNVVGTRNVADAANAVGARLIHVSSDYVFWGGDDRPDAGYREGDPPGPVRNYYALTKLVAEEAARRAPGVLIVRTSFRTSAWPHPAAFDDVHTGQDYVDVIATEFTHLLAHLDEVQDAILHIVTERKSVYDLVTRRTPSVRRGSRHDATVELPEDVSLDTTRWQAWKARWS